MSRRPSRLSGLLALLLAACSAYDSSLLGKGQANRMEAGTGGAGGSSGSGVMDDAGADEDGGVCVMTAEACNLVDDDCDGEVDEGAAKACEAILVNAVADCVLSMGRAVCVRIECLPGFWECDGKPQNGCEDMCLCRPCPDLDGGTDDDGGS